MIVVNGVRKRFGPAIALDRMSFTVRPGQVTGFVGPNGAGKSTTMRVILGLDAADQGRALIGGGAPRSPAAPAVPRRGAAGRRGVAAQPQRPQPPFVAGPLPGPGRPPGRRGAGAGPPAAGGPGAGRGVSPLRAPAA